MNTFQLTIQRQSKSGNQWPMVAEHTRPGVLLPNRTEGVLELEQSDFDELHSRLGHPKDYGTYLGQAVFHSEIGNAFIKAMSEYETPLHVLLFVEAQALSIRTLRWERLCAPIDGGWYLLRLDQRAPFSLYMPSQTDRRFPPIGKRDLRALVIVASPEDSERFGLAPFDVASTVAGIREALGDIPCEVLASMDDAVGPPSLNALCQQLTDRNKQYTLLHFVCHGRLLDDKETVLYLTNDENQVEPVPAERFLERLRSLQGARGLPHFAFFSTCESASPEAEGSLGGLGQRLVRDLGMPAVVAMTEKITIKTALRLGRRFYRQLRLSGKVDLALDEATAGLSEREDVTFPALYSRLGWQALFSDNLERDLTNLEIKDGLERLQTMLTERAPILQNEFDQQTKILQGTLEADITALTLTLRQEREQALYELNILCQEVCEISFNALALENEPPAYEARCPFLGLYPFRSNDREFFFGRENLIKALCQKLDEHHFLAVLGPSGSGKSSVILAGVVPQMQEQFSEFEMIDFTPTHDPMGQLTSAQAQVQTQPTLFVVDQFEEVFTLCTEEEQRQQFIDELLTLSQQQPVVITMRADFWGECAPYEALKNLMEQHQTLIGPMNTAELRAAMEQQAAKVGLRFEADLSNAILDDVSGEPGAMPLLQHALQELWKRRHGRWLNASEYREGIGGVKQAIAKTADAVYYPLSQADKVQFKNIFIRLTRLDDQAIQGEGRRDTRRRVGLEELLPAGGELSATKKLLNHLADARLVVTSMNAVTQQQEVEVAHEALIRYWPRLANWLDENRTNLQLRETIRQSALTWEENKRKEDFLIHKGARLEDAKMLARQTSFLNQLEAGYVSACVALVEAAEKAISRRRKITIASLTVGLILAVILSIFAVIQMQMAKEQRNEAKKEKEKAEKQTQIAVAEKARADKEKEAAEQATIAAQKSEKKAKEQTKIALVEKLGGQSILAAQLPSASNGYYEQALLFAAQAFKEKDNRVSRANLLRVLQAKKQRKTFLYGHYQWVNSVVFSPDGNILASGADDNTVILWDMKQRKSLGQPLTGHSNSVHNLAFSANGNILASASETKMMLWDVLQRKPLGEFLSDLPINSIALSSDGKLLASTSTYDIILWNLKRRKSLGKVVLRGHEATVNSILFSPDGLILASGSGYYHGPMDDSVRLWNVKQKKILGKPLTGHSQSVIKLAFSPDGLTLASSSYGEIILWDVKHSKLLYQPLNLKGESDWVNSLAFSPDSKTLASVIDNGKMILSDVKERQQKSEFLLTRSRRIKSASFSFDTNTLASANHNSKIIILWDIKPINVLGEALTEHSNSVKAFTFNSEGNSLAVVADKSLTLWNVTQKKWLDKQILTLTDIGFSYRVAFSPDGNLIAFGGSQLILWDVKQKKMSAELDVKNIESLAFSPDGNLIASGHFDNTIRLWNLKQKKALGKPLKGHSDSINSVAFSPDGKLLASGSNDNTVRLWDVLLGKALGKPLIGHSEFVNCVAFSPDGLTLASGSGIVPRDADEESLIHTVRLWDVLQRKQIGEPLTGHSNFVSSLAFNPDGSILASGSGDETVRLWDVLQQKPLGEPLSGNSASIDKLVFSPNGLILASGSEYGPVILWDMNPKSWLKKACSIANRNLSHKEWRQYMGEEPHKKTCPDLPKDTLGAIELLQEGLELRKEGQEEQAKAKFAQAREWDANIVENLGDYLQLIETVDYKGSED